MSFCVGCLILLCWYCLLLLDQDLLLLLSYSLATKYLSGGFGWLWVGWLSWCSCCSLAHCEICELWNVLLSTGYVWDVRYISLRYCDLGLSPTEICTYLLVTIWLIFTNLGFSIELCGCESLEWKLVQLCRATPGWYFSPCCLVLLVDLYPCLPFIFGPALIIFSSNWLWNHSDCTRFNYTFIFGTI